MARSGGEGPARPAREVRLVRMTDAERDEALRQEALDYGEAKARAGFWRPERALARARKEISELVGPDPGKRGHEFFFGLDPAGHRVGWIWYGPVPGSEATRGKRWLFQIVVEEALRGQGFGRALLEAVERHLRDEGMSELSLNVFRWNTVAVSLYASSGYEVVSQSDRNLEMCKRLVRA